MEKVITPKDANKTELTQIKNAHIAVSVLLL